MFEIFLPKPSVTAGERVPISSSYLFLFSEVILFCCYQLPGAQLNPSLPIFVDILGLGGEGIDCFPSEWCAKSRTLVLGFGRVLWQEQSNSMKTGPATETLQELGSLCASLLRFVVSLTLSLEN